MSLLKEKLELMSPSDSSAFLHSDEEHTDTYGIMCVNTESNPVCMMHVCVTAMRWRCMYVRDHGYEMAMYVRDHGYEMGMYVRDHGYEMGMHVHDHGYEMAMHVCT